MLQQLDRFAAEIQPHIARERGVLVAVHFHYIEFLQTQPLRGELVGELPEPLIANKACELGVQRGAQFADVSELAQARIGCGVPQEIRQLRGQFMLCQRLGLRRGAFLNEKQKLRRGQHDEQGVLDALREISVLGKGALPHGHQRRCLGLGDRPAVGASGKFPHDLARVHLWFILDGRADKNAPVRRRRPALVKRTLKFHRPNPQARPVPAVGVLAADADLAHTGEVIVVVLLHIVTRIIIDCTLEHIFPQRRARHFHRPLHRRKCATAIPAQAQVHSEPGRSFFEPLKPLGQLAVRRDRREVHLMRRSAGGGFRAELHWPRRQAYRQKRRLMSRGHELPTAEDQRHVFRFYRRRFQRQPSLAARRDQRLDLHLAQRACVQPHAVDAALEQLRILNTPDVQIHFRVIQHLRCDGSGGHLEPVHI